MIIIQISHKVLALSETYGRADQPSNLGPIPGYTTWNTERSGPDKGGGGLTLLYKESLKAHQWSPQVEEQFKYVEKERQWLLIEGSNKRCAFLHTYIACQTTRHDSFLQWNEDLFQLLTLEAIKLRKSGYVILAMGDFNTRVGQINGLEQNTSDTNCNTPMFLNFITQVNLVIINTLPIARGLFTRFMTNTSTQGSLLDYGLIDSDHTHTVTSFVIDEHARHDCGSDHALLECKILFSNTPKVSWSFNDVIQYNIKEDTNYSEYQNTLDQLISTVSMTEANTMTA